MLVNFFVRTAILLNRLRCTAILSALQAGEEAESGRSGSQGGALRAAPSPSRRSDPDLDITEIGDIRSDDGQYGSGGCLNARRPTSMGGAYWAEFWVAVIIYIEYRRARARARC